MSNQIFMSYYNSVKHQDISTMREIDLSAYVSFIKAGTVQDLVLKARAEKQKGNLDEYKRLKNLAPVVTGSCTILEGKTKEVSNISEMNGLMFIDMDNDQVTTELYELLKTDEYTHILHTSFGGGDNYVIIVRIDSNRFEDTFQNLGQYYLDKFGIKIDASCKNKNRLRFISYDPDIFTNEKSKRWKATKPKQKVIKRQEVEYLFVEDDFDNIIKQIGERSIDLCQDDYIRWVNIGMAIAVKFGQSGGDKFDYICSFGSKYDARTNADHYRGFCDSVVKGNKEGSNIGIGTFYYYCKEAGINLYSDKTKAIISSVKVGKSQGNPTIESVSKHLEKQGFDVTEADESTINQVLESKTDFSRLANSELKNIEILDNFLIDRFEPYLNEIDQNVYVEEDVEMCDDVFNYIYIECKKHLDLKNDLTKDNITSLLKNPTIQKRNPVMEFFDKHFDPNYSTGHIDAYIDTIEPKSEYNRWAFKRWIIGAVHNWIREDPRDTSPLTLVLSGDIHGGGKTSWIRDLLPDGLDKYFDEGKLDIDKNDSVYKMGVNLIMSDDEFGGKSFKDDKDFKAISDKPFFKIRRPYGRMEVKVIRRVALCGTTNERDILKDITGEQRRILPINLTRINLEESKKVDKIKLLCEAFGELVNGFEWKIYKEEDVAYLTENTRENQQIMPMEEIFFNYFALDRNETFNTQMIVNRGNILEFFKRKNVVEFNGYDLKSIFTKNKMRYKNNDLNGRTKYGISVFCRYEDVVIDWQKGSVDDGMPF